MLVIGAAAGCGGDDEASSGTGARTVTETVTGATAPPPTREPTGSLETQPPPETQAAPPPGETVPSAPPSAADAPSGARCGDVTITPNSGDGAFDVRADGVGCAEAERLLKDPNGLRDWNCRPAAQTSAGAERFRCEKGGRTIEFETGV